MNAAKIFIYINIYNIYYYYIIILYSYFFSVSRKVLNDLMTNDLMTWWGI